jgi:hypothetical protein
MSTGRPQLQLLALLLDLDHLRSREHPQPMTNAAREQAARKTIRIDLRTQRRENGSRALAAKPATHRLTI